MSEITIHSEHDPDAVILALQAQIEAQAASIAELERVLGVIAGRSMSEDGSYYKNRASIREARAALKGGDT